MNKKPTVSIEALLNQLQAAAHPQQLVGMARYGMSVEHRLGVKIPEIRRLAKETGRDHELALALWATGIAEARILASMVDTPAAVTSDQMDSWVVEFDSWDVCDQVCMNLFDKTPLAWGKVRQWTVRDEEYVRRAGFALIACLAWHDKRADDGEFIDLFPLIRAGATDERNYVKKAVSWALRQIGKRNAALHHIALEMGRDLQGSESKVARWIGKDVERDLTSKATLKRIG